MRWFRRRFSGRRRYPPPPPIRQSPPVFPAAADIPHSSWAINSRAQALISIDPVRAKNDPAVVKNVPFYKAKKALEAEVMKLDPPPRPQNWGDLELPLDPSSWTKEDLKDPKKLYEMTVLLNAQTEIADKILDAQWETKWREEKLNEMLKEKVEPYLHNIEQSVLPQPIVLQPQKDDNQKIDQGRRRWWLF